MYLSNRYGRINGKAYEPGDPIEEPEKIDGHVLAILLSDRTIVLATDPHAPKAKAPKWAEEAAPEEVKIEDPVEVEDKPKRSRK